MPLTPSTRWCPTPEQLMILEEMYRSGVRTPNATLIQQITAHLSCYGKIEGKNVFYWFQNHKARDRQKLRRRLNGNHQPHEAAPPPRPLTHQHSPPHFLEGGLQEEIQGMDLLGKLDSGGSEDEERATSSITLGFEWMTTMDFSSVTPASCRPVQTLDLFPTKSTRDECSSSKSSSCSTSTN